MSLIPITDTPQDEENNNCISYKILNEILLVDSYNPVCNLGITDNLSMVKYAPPNIDVVLFCNLPEGHTWGNHYADHHISDTERFETLKKNNAVVVQGCEQPLNNYHGFCAVGLDFGDFETFKVLDRSPLLFNKLNDYSDASPKDFLILLGGKNERQKFVHTLNNKFSLDNSLTFRYKMPDLSYLPIPDSSIYEEYSTHSFQPYDWFSHEGMVELNRDILPHKKMFQDCLVNVVIETNQKIQTPYPYLSEKTYKPIIHETPFTIFAEPNSLNFLRNKGFATFDNIVDESYDKIINYDERLNAVVDASIELLSKIKSKNPQIREICKHNKEHFLNKNRQQNLIMEFKNKIDSLSFGEVQKLYNNVS